jgi:hypothetical protein
MSIIHCTHQNCTNNCADRFWFESDRLVLIQ